ncbi:MAG: Smr/MutS family protein [Christensenellaceae bacterium]|nr:Smr/MutS family protein [Christensenellaceae bacterium]
MEAEFEEKRNAALKKANEEAYEIISKAKEESEKLIKEIRRTRNMTESESTKIVDNARKALSEKKDKAKEKIKQKPKAAGKKLTAEDIRLGDSVRILTLDAEGTVTQLPDSRGNVGVRAGILTMNVKISDLELLDNSGKKQVVASTRVRLAQKSISLSVNLQGMNVEDALIELNQYLDDAFLSGLKEVSVVHGKGSGILRSNVHTFLRKHPHVENFRLGKYGEGETGVTIVTLK